jgi:hypothetical protein
MIKRAVEPTFNFDAPQLKHTWRGICQGMKLGRRALPIAWALMVAETVMVLRRHWGTLPPRSQQRMKELVTKSKGRPDKLTREERRELIGHVRQIDLGGLARDVGEVASPVRLPGRLRRRR